MAEYTKIQFVGPGAATARIPDARAFQFSGSAFSATIKTEKTIVTNGIPTGSVISSATFLGDATPTNIIPVAATQFTASSNGTTIIVYS